MAENSLFYDKKPDIDHGIFPVIPPVSLWDNSITVILQFFGHASFSKTKAPTADALNTRVRQQVLQLHTPKILCGLSCEHSSALPS
jgi:hypothetical protein